MGCLVQMVGAIEGQSSRGENLDGLDRCLLLDEAAIEFKEQTRKPLAWARSFLAVVALSLGQAHTDDVDDDDDDELKARSRQVSCQSCDSCGRSQAQRIHERALFANGNRRNKKQQQQPRTT